ILVPFIRDKFEGSSTGFSLLTGTIVLSVMILPTITTIATDAMASLPNSIREGSYALGGTRFQTIWRVLVSASLLSLFTAILLGLPLAFGYALALQMVI